MKMKAEIRSNRCSLRSALVSSTAASALAQSSSPSSSGAGGSIPHSRIPSSIRAITVSSTGHARASLRVALDQVPAGVRLVGASEHVLDRLGVGTALLAVAPVLVGQLPALELVLLRLSKRFSCSSSEMCIQSLIRSIALVRERALEVVDLAVGAHPLLAAREALDPLDENPAVPRAVEDGHASPARDLRPEAPQEVVALLVRRRGGELSSPARDADRAARRGA